MHLTTLFSCADAIARSKVLPKKAQKFDTRTAQGALAASLASKAANPNWDAVSTERKAAVAAFEKGVKPSAAAATAAALPEITATAGVTTPRKVKRRYGKRHKRARERADSEENEDSSSPEEAEGLEAEDSDPAAGNPKAVGGGAAGAAEGRKTAAGGSTGKPQGAGSADGGSLESGGLDSGKKGGVGAVDPTKKTAGDGSELAVKDVDSEGLGDAVKSIISHLSGEEAVKDPKAAGGSKVEQKPEEVTAPGGVFKGKTQVTGILTAAKEWAALSAKANPGGNRPQVQPVGWTGNNEDYYISK